MPRAAWNDTGIDVRRRPDSLLLCDGPHQVGSGTSDGPEGEHNSPDKGARPMPGQRRAALIGRVGDSEDYFLIGDNRGSDPHALVRPVVSGRERRFVAGQCGQLSGHGLLLDSALLSASCRPTRFAARAPLAVRASEL